MTLKPWREVAKPHKDVLEGRFKQSEFAADISQVHNGKATEEYQDPEKFFARTFITEGMRLLLISVAQRLSGNGGDPVIQLQTAFGGGKTHTMLAVYHFASRNISTEKLQGIPTILDEARIDTVPTAKVAVIDGINISPSQSSVKDGVKINTLWGNLAYQLLGHEGYQMVSESDQSGTSPGKEVLIKLLQKAAPCVILIDELVAYIRQMESGQKYNGGTFDSNISFIQALTEALKSVPNALLLASLPESDLEVGGSSGQKALNSLEKYFARIESVWKPVATEEAFEIVRRRLFEHPGSANDIEHVCREFSNFYAQYSDQFPAETQSNLYFERLCRSYPIHPEIFDRLYEDWSTLDKFQRTRGVLQYMAIVINKLWNSDNKDALIMPGSIPLKDPDVLNKSIHYLPQGWQPVIEREVDGRQSEADYIDGHDTRFGSIQAARRSARTIFLGSAPSAMEQTIRGIKSERVLLGSLQPGQTIGVFEDVLKRLRDKLHYLYSEQDRFWFDTKPNLRREMESRKQRINEQEQVIPLIKKKVNEALSRNNFFSGIHVFTNSGDIPDDYGNGPKLVILPITAGFSRDQSNASFTHAEKILHYRGEQPRQKKNRLVFLAPDFDIVERLKDQTRIYLSWKSIADDIDSGTLNQDIAHLKQSKRNRDAAEKSLSQIIRETFKWLIVPSEEFQDGKPRVRWEAVSISPSASNLLSEIGNKLKEEEWIITRWSPIFLKEILNKWYFKENIFEVSALKVWQDSCNYLYLPRILNENVFKETISNGLQSKDFFAFSAGKEDGKYLDFTFGKSHITHLSEASLIIEHNKAIEYENSLLIQENNFDVGSVENAYSSKNTVEAVHKQDALQAYSKNITSTNITQNLHSGNENKKQDANQFYGSINIDHIQAKIEFSRLIDEVVERFSEKIGVDVTISVEIQAKSSQGFDNDLQRTIKENCNALNFKTSEFEQD